MIPTGGPPADYSPKQVQQADFDPPLPRVIGFAVVVTSTTGFSMIHFTRAHSSDAAIRAVLDERAKAGAAFTGGNVLAFVVDNNMLDKARTP